MPDGFLSRREPAGPVINVSQSAEHTLCQETSCLIFARNCCSRSSEEASWVESLLIELHHRPLHRVQRRPSNALHQPGAVAPSWCIF